MAWFITEADLAPLFQDPRGWDTLLAAVEQSFLTYQRKTAPLLGWQRIPLNPPGYLRLAPGLEPEAGAVLRIYPVGIGADASGTTKVMMLFHPESGELMALISDRTLAQYRTGAPAGVGARVLGPKNPRILGLVGSGRQAFGQVRAMMAACPTIAEIRIYSPRREHREAFARETAQACSALVRAVHSAEEAVREADLVDLATNSPNPVIERDWVKRGALVISIAANQLPPDLILHSRVIVSSSLPLANAPGREPYTGMIRAGQWSVDAIAAELGEVLLGEKPARDNPDECVIFEMPGMSVWDVAAARWAYDWALQNGRGREFSLQ